MEPRIQAAIALLKDDIRRDVPLVEIACRVNISTSRLRHIFKEETGVSPRQYCKALRIQKAKELIVTTFLNMKQIMSKVGIKNKNSFARDFKRAYGFTPTQYRKWYKDGSTTEE